MNDKPKAGSFVARYGTQDSNPAGSKFNLGQDDDEDDDDDAPAPSHSPSNSNSDRGFLNEPIELQDSSDEDDGKSNQNDAKSVSQPFYFYLVVINRDTRNWRRDEHCMRVEMSTPPLPRLTLGMCRWHASKPNLMYD